LENEEVLYVVTGCAHPDIVNITERVKHMFPEQPIALVTGGFHPVYNTDEEIMKISAKLRKLGVKKIAHSHCTGRSAMEIFKQGWGEQHLRLCLSDTFCF
jgi:7,8-dihydropterin-6-yl-methyl-4-(beta-D-ribofuranosyl)aminobenzene 5'-phosphate synthase